MTSSFYVKLLLGAAAVIVLVVLVMVAVARADYPNGFQRVSDLLDQVGRDDGDGFIMKQVTGKNILNDDPNNKQTLRLNIAKSDKGIGVGFDVFEENGDVFVSIAIFHMADDTTVLVNFVTGEDTTDITDETVQKFIALWFATYEKLEGTII